MQAAGRSKGAYSLLNFFSNQLIAFSHMDWHGFLFHDCPTLQSHPHILPSASFFGSISFLTPIPSSPSTASAFTVIHAPRLRSSSARLQICKCSIPFTTCANTGIYPCRPYQFPSASSWLNIGIFTLSCEYSHNTYREPAIVRHLPLSSASTI